MKKLLFIALFFYVISTKINAGSCCSTQVTVVVQQQQQAAPAQQNVAENIPAQANAVLKQIQDMITYYSQVQQDQIDIEKMRKKIANNKITLTNNLVWYGQYQEIKDAINLAHTWINQVIHQNPGLNLTTSSQPSNYGPKTYTHPQPLP